MSMSSLQKRCLHETSVAFQVKRVRGSKSSPFLSVCEMNPQPGLYFPFTVGNVFLE